MDHSKAVYITDMGACTPAAALSAEHRKYRWQTVPYEAEGVSGTMIYSGPETDTPPVTLPLGVSGWHAVFLGLYSNIHMREAQGAPHRRPRLHMVRARGVGHGLHRPGLLRAVRGQGGQLRTGRAVLEVRRH